MTPHQRTRPADPDRYEIRIGGRLDSRWRDWFDGLVLSVDRDGTTILRGPVADQAALHGVLRKVRDLGLPLVSVIQLDPGPPAVRTTSTRVPKGIDYDH